MFQITTQQAVLMLKIMNLAAWHYPESVRNSPTIDQIERLRFILESNVGTVTEEIQ